ncbi:uncharacterized protein LOC131333781 [Rhododendron vialii]|uniref:uncharacterized protein LOC131333781 n=1 Tax=Rhododendron vialii TaxID=182163 RepID=UPI00265FB3DD|nr:uncharacterized protein LOC131333781 [Rhododendron vialii]
MELWLLVQVMVQQPGFTWVSAQVELCFASSAEWSRFEHAWQLFGGPVLRGSLEVCIQTDRSVFVYGLCYPQGAAAGMQPALEDFCFQCSSINYVRSFQLPIICVLNHLWAGAKWCYQWEHRYIKSPKEIQERMQMECIP